MVASARHHSLLLLIAAACVGLVLAACRTGVPVLDANPGPASVMGTITGNVSGEDGRTPIAGRRVTVVNLETGERISATTSDTGGYTLKVAPARYRIEVQLEAGEMLVKHEGPFTVSRSELQHDVDLRIGVRRSEAGRIYQPPLPIRAPIA